MSSPHFHWYLPTTTDNRNLVPSHWPERRVDLNYMGDVCRAAERNGFESILLPTGERGREDAWTIASALIAQTRRLRFLVALRSGYVAPAQVAQMAASFSDLSGGRLDLNVVTGGYEAAMRAHGDQFDKSARYRRTAEFIDVLRHCWSGKPFDYHGEFFTLLDVPASAPLEPSPSIFFGGSSPDGLAVAARQADVHLIYGELPPAAAEHVRTLREQAEEHGRSLSFGIRIQVITRPHHEDAWREADLLMAEFNDDIVHARQNQLQARNSVGQQRVQSVRSSTGNRDDLTVYPTIWAGTGLVAGGGSSTALVGSHEEVAERIAEYHQAGIDHFILSGFPRLESVYEVGEGVLPLFGPTHRETATPALASPTEGAVL